MTIRPTVLAGFAIQALQANKMRSFLTMLGVIIGVGAVIVMMAIGQGTQNQVLSRINQLGANRLTVMAGAQGGPPGRTTSAGNPLTLSDVEDISQLSFVKAVAPTVRGSVVATQGNHTWNTGITGTTPEMADISSLVLQSGRFFNQADLKAASPVAVLGQTAYENLFSYGVDPVGSQIRLQGISFRVIGLLRPVGATAGSDQDDVIYIPVTTAQIRLLGTSNQLVNAITVEVQDQAYMDRVQADITSLLRKKHQLTEAQEDDFRIMNNAQIQEQVESVTGTLTLFLAAVAGISLVVGGIGIMNIMLVSVTERTREIGVRMAIGASKRDILAQFLLEAVLMSLGGSLIGILLGMVATEVFAMVTTWPVAISLSSVLLAVGTASIIGIFFGFYPARHAANLNPAQALSYE